MNKYEYLDELRRRIGRLPQYDIDNAVNAYSVEIGRMLDEEWDWGRIEGAIGSPKEAARRVLDGRPVYVSQNNMPGYRYNGPGVYQSAYGGGANGGAQGNAPKSKRGAFWKYYFIFGLITIPLTIAALATAFALCAAAFGLAAGGAAAIIYSVIIGITTGSLLVFLTYCGAALLVLGTGLLFAWVIKIVFKSVIALLGGKNRRAEE